jgi:hypothetical protein
MDLNAAFRGHKTIVPAERLDKNMNELEYAPHTAVGNLSARMIWTVGLLMNVQHSPFSMHKSEHVAQ